MKHLLPIQLTSGMQGPIPLSSDQSNLLPPNSQVKAECSEITAEQLNNYMSNAFLCR